MGSAHIQGDDIKVMSSSTSTTKRDWFVKSRLEYWKPIKPIKTGHVTTFIVLYCTYLNFRLLVDTLIIFVLLPMFWIISYFGFSFVSFSIQLIFSVFIRILIPQANSLDFVLSKRGGLGPCTPSYSARAGPFCNFSWFQASGYILVYIFLPQVIFVSVQQCHILQCV